MRKAERGLWQRRYWEYLIRDERDLLNHIDYIHFNPVKHGWTACVQDWPHSSFHRYASDGYFPEDWGQVQGCALTQPCAPERRDGRCPTSSGRRFPALNH